MDYKPKIKLSQDEFRVLASDTRIEILKRLDESQLTVSDLSRKLDMNKATVHEHLTKLIGVGLVKKDDSPRKWVYYRLTWKGKNLLHPERVRVMVSLGIMLTVIVLGTLLIASQTDFITPDPQDDPPITPMETTVHLFWAEEGTQANVYDINIKGSTAVVITEVKELKTYIEDDPTSITKRNSISLDWARGTNVIHLYDYDGLLGENEGKYLYVEGILLDDRTIERPFNLRRYIMPTGFEIDLRISALGIMINTSLLNDTGRVTISFDVENRGNVDVESTLVEVFSVRPTFMASGFPSYGSPYLNEIHNETLSVPVNGSVTISFSKPVRELFRRGIMMVVDPNNEMAEGPIDNNMVTQMVPDEVRLINKDVDDPGTPSEDEGGTLGTATVMAVIAIMVVLITIVVILLRKN